MFHLFFSPAGHKITDFSLAFLVLLVISIFFSAFFFSLKKKKIFLEQPPAAVKQLLISPSGHWNSIGSYFLVSVFFILVPCWGEKRALQLSAERGPKDELSNFPTDLHFFFVFAKFFFWSAASFAYRLQRGKVEQLNEIRLKRQNGIW